MFELQGNRKINKIFEISIQLLYIYIFWGINIQHMVFIKPIMVFAMAGLLFLLFLILWISITNFKIRKNSICLVWLPYLLYICFGYLVNGDIEYLLYRMICFFMITCAFYIPNFADYLPTKLIIINSVIAIIGILFQIVFMGQYNSIIASLFSNRSMITYLGSVGYFNGFFYQWELTAEAILYGIGIILYFKNNNDTLKLKILRRLYLVLSVGCIFLTGKRMLSVLSIIVPVFVSWCGQKGLNKKIKFLMVCCILGVSLLFVSSSGLLKNTQYQGLNKVTEGIETILSGSKIEDTTRSDLQNSAILLFKENPVFGCGVGRFIMESGSDTDVHNTYLQILCEQGVVGILLYLIPLILIFIKTIIRTRENTDDSYLKYSLYIQTVYLLNSFTENAGLNLSGFIVYFIAIGILNRIESNTQMEDDYV